MRRIGPDEQALWSRVARTVRKFGEKAAPASPEFAWFQPSMIASDANAHATVPRSSANTLDGRWDRQLATGRVAPDRVVDLHGHNLAGAHARLDSQLDLAIRAGDRLLLIITGKAPTAGRSRLDLPQRGIIRASISDWLAASRHASRIAAVRPAHPRHGGAGALYLILRRARTATEN